MITTVSDILQFQKCPYAWWVRTVKKRNPIGSSPALEQGTAIHKELAAFLSGPAAGTISLEASPNLHALDGGSLTRLANLRQVNKWEEVERAHRTTIGGHQINFRPDAVSLGSYGTYNIWQWKSVSAKKAHYSEYVRCSPHESLYHFGLKANGYKVGTNIFVGIYVKSKSKKVQPKFYTSMVYLPQAVIEANLQFIVRTADRMEQMIDETKGDEASALTWKTQQSCIDWITGTKCPLHVHCHGNISFTNSNWFEETQDRYPELAGLTSLEPQASAGVGVSNYHEQGADQNPKQETV